MLDIQKTYNDDAIIYSFSGSTDSSGLENVVSLLNEDCNNTYTFIFNFKNIKYMSVESIQMLKHLYILSIDNAYNIIIEELNPQAQLMFEIFQIDTLYAVNNTIPTQKGLDNVSTYSA